MPVKFMNQLTKLFKGLYWLLAKNHPVHEIGEGPGTHHGEGKAPMSTDLYKSICTWLLEYGTAKGLFVHCFLTLMWNLACRLQNTSLIKFKDISWSRYFDAYQVFFEHSKIDQLGEESKYPWHIYANPLELCVCPILSLSLYFSCCFNCPISLNSNIFPGREQEEHFSKILY